MRKSTNQLPFCHLAATHSPTQRSKLNSLNQAANTSRAERSRQDQSSHINANSSCTDITPLRQEIKQVSLERAREILSNHRPEIINETMFQNQRPAYNDRHVNQQTRYLDVMHPAQNYTQQISDRPEMYQQRNRVNLQETVNRNPQPRRHTNDLTVEVQSSHVREARRKFKKAQLNYRDFRYFDCIDEVQEALSCLGTELQPSLELMQSQRGVYELIKDCYLQTASCYIRLEEFKEAIFTCDIILDIEPSNVKALFLRGCAHEDMKQLTRALEDFKKAHELSPADQYIHNHLKRCQSNINYERQQRQQDMLMRRQQIAQQQQVAKFSKRQSDSTLDSDGKKSSLGHLTITGFDKGKRQIIQAPVPSRRETGQSVLVSMVNNASGAECSEQSNPDFGKRQLSQAEMESARSEQSSTQSLVRPPKTINQGLWQRLIVFVKSLFQKVRHFCLKNKKLAAALIAALTLCILLMVKQISTCLRNRRKSIQSLADRIVENID